VKASDDRVEREQSQADGQHEDEDETEQGDVAGLGHVGDERCYETGHVPSLAAERSTPYCGAPRSGGRHPMQQFRDSSSVVGRPGRTLAVMTHPRGRHLVPLLAIALGFAGCGGTQDRAEQQALGGADARPIPALSAQTDLRQVVFTADLTVRVADAARATKEATQLARAADGLVFAQSSDLEGRREARLTLKVPPDRFESVLDSLAELGQALERDVKAQDVTEEVVDVEGRLKTAQASAERLRTLLGGAASTADVVAVEAELAKRESEIESLQGRLRVLDSRVDLATIDVRLTERADLEVNRDVPGFLKALRAGWVALLNVVLAFVAVAGFLLPFAPFVVAGWWAVRRYRSRHPRLPRPDPPSPPPSWAPSPAGGAPTAGSGSAPADAAPADIG